MPNNKKLRSRKKKEAARSTTRASANAKDFANDNTALAVFLRFSSDLVCYHGSTEDVFMLGNEQNYLYLRTIDLWFRQYDKEMIKCNNNFEVFDISRGTENGDVLDSIITRFINDIEFSKFLISFCAETYMNDPTEWCKLMPLFLVAIKIKYEQGELELNQFKIWYREMTSDRGFIKSLAEAMPCDCLKEMKKAAKKILDPTALCSHCRVSFPRDDLLMCSGCRVGLYCSETCQKKGWPRHKEHCKKISSMNKQESE